MPEPALAVDGKPLSQGERVVDTFVAPSKTFTTCCEAQAGGCRSLSSRWPDTC